MTVKVQIKRLLVMMLCVMTVFISLPITSQAAPRKNSNLYATPKFHSSEGCLQYIEKHGIESYVTINTLNLEQFLIDNPDFVAANITTRELVWQWLNMYDSISPRYFHSTNPEEEYYCKARNLCIQLGVYGPTSKLSVYEKCKIIHDEVAYRCDYDFTYSRYSYKDIFDSNYGVCNAFGTYGMIMFTIAGVENGFVFGPNHVWNAVLAEDGNWYQIDLCWDACYGYSTHYFWMTNRCDISGNVSIAGDLMIPTSQDIYITQDLR